MADRRVSTAAVAACLLPAALACAAGAAAEVRDPHGVAVIVGNRDYAERGLSDVEYAVRDARAFERYVLDVLGYPPQNVLVLENATRLRMFEAFGRPSDPPGGPSDLWALLDPEGRSDVAVFYSGHGAPGRDDGEGYLLPVDVPARSAQDEGYPIAALYDTLAALRSAPGRSARSARVYLDACFSGMSQRGSVFVGVSPAFPVAALPENVADGVAVLSAGGPREFASWDEDAGHGMFTRHLLDALYGAGDADGDDRVTAREAKKWLDEHMTRAVWLRHRAVQTAHLLLGSASDAVLSSAPPGGFPARPMGDTPPPPPDEEEYLEVASGDPPPPPPPDAEAAEKALGLSREDWRSVQLGLDALDFDPGPADGDPGPRTRKAISSWQDEKGYGATGRLTGDQAETLVAVGREVLERVQQEQARGPSIGEAFRDCPHCPEMVVVPAGSFTMGSPSSESGRNGDEGPQRRVEISSPFAVGVYEVTFAEWDACASDGGCRGYHPDDEGWGGGGRPVINVDWNDAKAYASWLSRETGESYRLLSEAEWEYVARAGTTTRFWWGDDIGRNRANCSSSSCGDSHRGTAPVGSFRANGFGLHDVHGNVREWVEDCWHGSYAGAPRDGRAWLGNNGGECSLRILRGGSWLYYPRDLRSAVRNRLVTGNRINYIGFRVARTFAP